MLEVGGCQEALQERLLEVQFVRQRRLQPVLDVRKKKGQEEEAKGEEQEKISTSSCLISLAQAPRVALSA